MQIQNDGNCWSNPSEVKSQTVRFVKICEFVAETTGSIDIIESDLTIDNSWLSISSVLMKAGSFIVVCHIIFARPLVTLSSPL